MSLDRYKNDRPQFPDTVARCKKTALKDYMGGRRRPIHPDELGAMWVIDLFFGDRLAFFVDVFHADYFLVVRREGRQPDV